VIARLFEGLGLAVGIVIVSGEDTTTNAGPAKPSIRVTSPGFDTAKNENIFNVKKEGWNPVIQVGDEEQSFWGVKSINPDILVEAELGYIGTSSKLLDAIPEGVDITEDMRPNFERLA